MRSLPRAPKLALEIKHQRKRLYHAKRGAKGKKGIVKIWLVCVAKGRIVINGACAYEAKSRMTRKKTQKVEKSRFYLRFCADICADA